MDRGAWQAIIHVVTKSQTWLSNWTHMVIAEDTEKLVLLILRVSVLQKEESLEYSTWVFSAP